MTTTNTATIRQLLTGRILTNIGDSLIYMSVLWYFNTRYQSALFVTAVFVITSGVDALSFLLGPILDRVRVKRVLVGATASQVILALMLVGGMALRLNGGLLGVFLLVFLLLSTIGSALIYPTEDKLLPLLASGADLLHVNGLFQMSYQVLDLILNGAVLGLLSLLSVQHTLLLAVPVFGVALLVFKLLRLKPASSANVATDSYGRSLKAGWQTLAQHPFMLKVLIPFAAVNLFYGAADAALPRFARTYLSGQAWGYGALLTGIAVGGLVGALLVQKLTLTGNHLITFAGGCLILGGGCRLLLAVSRQGVVAVLLISMSALFVSMMNINFIAYVQSAFPAAVLGRISTINESLISAMIPIGSALGGVMVTHWAVIWPQLIYGGATVLNGLYFLAVIRRTKFE